VDENNLTTYTKLRDDIMDQLLKVSDSLVEGEEAKFNVLMLMAQNSNDKELLKRAFKAAVSLEDRQQRADALMTVLDEVEIRINSDGVNNEEVNYSDAVDKNVKKNDTSIDEDRVEEQPKPEQNTQQE
jgi:hypothetical protein